jgi:hypothetical protein
MYSGKDIEKNLLKTATDPALVDVIKDYAEAGIDAVFKTELVEALPVVKSVSAILKGVATVQDRMFLKKVARFLSSANKMTLKERDEWYEKHIHGDESLEDKLADKLMIMIDAVNDNYKADILGKLFLAFIKGDIETLEHFFFMTELVENCFTDTLRALAEGRSVTDDALYRAGIKHASVPTGRDISEMLDRDQGLASRGMTTRSELPYRSAEYTPAGKLLLHILKSH